MKNGGLTKKRRKNKKWSKTDWGWTTVEWVKNKVKKGESTRWK